MKKHHAAAIMLFLVFPAAVAQSLSNETSAQVPLKAPVIGGTDAFDANQGEHFRGEAAAQALAAFGVLKVGGTGRAWFFLNDGRDIFQTSYESTARSKTRFFDYLTFTGQPAGTEATLAFDLLLRGEQATAGAGTWGSALSSWQFDLRVAGQPLQLYRSETAAVNPTDGPSFTVVDPDGAFSTHRFEVPIRFGQAVALDARLEAIAVANVQVASAADGFFEASYDLARSAYWGGIAELRFGGVPVSFVLESASGTDYLRSMVPVPEARSAALLGLGLLGLWAWLRPRTSSASPAASSSALAGSGTAVGV